MCHFAIIALLLLTRINDPFPQYAITSYSQPIPDSKAAMEMVSIRAGTFMMGSSKGEPDRKADEGPQFEVKVQAFWMGKHEVTWDQYRPFLKQYHKATEKRNVRIEPTDARWLDAVSIPTPIYCQFFRPRHYFMGTERGYPVSSISHLAARQYCKWLSKKTGHFYRLPTEAEWEYAARAGTSSAYSFGDDPKTVGDYAWYFDNSDYKDPKKGHPGYQARYRKVGSKKPNRWGLYDMHGNVSEWVLDQYKADHYKQFAGKTVNAKDIINWPKTKYPCVARGGNWDSDPEACRSASRLASSKRWLRHDPQVPQSRWWNTDAYGVGFRIVRPANKPSKIEQLRHWESVDKNTDEVLKTGLKQMRIIVGKQGKKK